MKTIKKCDICGKEYLAAGEKRRYCSDPCRKEANLRNIRERNRQRAEKAKESMFIEVPEKEKKRNVTYGDGGGRQESRYELRTIRGEDGITIQERGKKWRD